MQQHKLYARDEIYRMLAAALIEKKPQPPENWSVVKLDEEVTSAGRDYEPNLYLRHGDALLTAVFYLVDFARRMPERVDLSTETVRVHDMCGELADEIEQITYEPEAVIARDGKLKVGIKAILAVGTHLVYCDETDRFIAEEREAKRQSRIQLPVKNKTLDASSRQDKWLSDLARTIFQKVSVESNEKSSAQLSLF